MTLFKNHENQSRWQAVVSYVKTARQNGVECVPLWCQVMSMHTDLLPIQNGTTGTNFSKIMSNVITICCLAFTLLITTIILGMLLIPSSNTKTCSNAIRHYACYRTLSPNYRYVKCCHWLYACKNFLIFRAFRPLVLHLLCSHQQ
jgi:hypothetical protein